MRRSAPAWFALPKSTYTPFHDVTLPTPDGTTQIDHIFVSRFGVFVVETKNMGGWIFGGVTSRPPQSTRACSVSLRSLYKAAIAHFVQREFDDYLRCGEQGRALDPGATLTAGVYRRDERNWRHIPNSGASGWC